MLQELLTNNSKVINYLTVFIACFLIGYCLSSIKHSKRAQHTIEKRLLSDTYYAYAIISFKFKTIDWYCGNIRIGSDEYSLLEGSSLTPGFYNGFIHNSILQQNLRLYCQRFCNYLCFLLCYTSIPFESIVA